MLGPRLLRIQTSSCTCPSTFQLRPLSTTSALCRAPSLRDITPDNATSFNARQKEFRENLEAARKKKEQAETMRAKSPGSAAAAAAAPGVPDAADTLDTQGLGSLSTHRIVGEHRQSDASHAPKRVPCPA
ncbi:conserved hypothetical protein [Histoplasma capsulatum H143]|uniref:Uncharacterized protein n=1 Tax=Ajellomyces capsulatus (strain H143) TaxID=544712 RepID=C6HLZ9_AJECH|nr:conserved hypothetical protein [Histoplasma capsulatum H143]